ncbi:hypothetical protein O9H85_08150 [Paenibacillus filicis]|uniref:Uncharacterized protein n=1 Tax=Paenibacillus gyeongsangnamensis TaxID=3388067 RepID=A0ABT4Q6B4_9BACL|nr:hypothetical protein [Paenibacillus filicis]MCZ8512404.1 hypothetical protein [Paenibacillus filicis]
MKYKYTGEYPVILPIQNIEIEPEGIIEVDEPINNAFFVLIEEKKKKEEVVN